MAELSHFDESGAVRMVDVSGKFETLRRAEASAKVRLAVETVSAIKDRTNPKGDPLEIARISGILAAKRTSELIPLCHQINLAKADVSIKFADYGLEIRSEVVTKSETGVEMEALTAVTIAALTVYDMCKAIQKDIEITDVRLESKTGGKADYFRG